MAKQAPIKWSQRADSVLLVIPLRDVENTNVKFSDNRFQFQANSSGAGYYLDVELVSINAYYDYKILIVRIIINSLTLRLVQRYRYSSLIVDGRTGVC